MTKNRRYTGVTSVTTRAAGEGPPHPPAPTPREHARMIILLLMSDKGPPPAHPLSAGRNATPSHSLGVRSPVCVLTRAGLPGLTSTYSGG